MNTRLLGLMGVLGGAALAAIEIRHLITGVRLNGATIDGVDNVLYGVWGLGMFCAFWAIYQLGATGQNKIMRLAPFIAMIGFAAMAIGSLFSFTGPKTIADVLIGVAWIGILLGTLVTGILALIARVWVGWRKFTPLICILAIPLLIIVGLVTGSQVGDPLFGLSWMLLGYAVLSSNTEQSLQTVRA
ncbi:MAG TPA: hypothetical protein VJL59_09310 [Anaerolineales bacterium]|nr:hypothetical protein [Anaerolineales bacterium]